MDRRPGRWPFHRPGRPYEGMHMLFMNEHEIDEAVRRHREHPVLGPAARTLDNLRSWTDRNSDGWAYWPKPCRAAAQLQALIQAADPWRRNGNPDPTPAGYRKALGPIKSFRTRHGADFTIEETTR